ncbi:MAG: Hsp20/alpha crystallin family protein [Desulfurococcales archaeon]|nr:Hsp20/alpha crystallin family protein [Desulfurococcales archaeon]
MSSYWDWFEEFRRYVRERIKNIEDLFNEIHSEIDSSLFTGYKPGNLEEPLYRIEDHGDHYRILIDLPAADPDSVVVDVFEDHVLIKANIREEAMYEYENALGRRVWMRNYSTSITFPSPIDTSTVKAERKANILIITVKKK